MHCECDTVPSLCLFAALAFVCVLERSCCWLVCKGMGASTVFCGAHMSVYRLLCVSHPFFVSLLSVSGYTGRGCGRRGTGCVSGE
jgi:hypothetical protein